MPPELVELDIAGPGSGGRMRGAFSAQADRPAQASAKTDANGARCL
jgi:hypothetical protein